MKNIFKNIFSKEKFKDFLGNFKTKKSLFFMVFISLIVIACIISFYFYFFYSKRTKDAIYNNYINQENSIDEVKSVVNKENEIEINDEDEESDDEVLTNIDGKQVDKNGNEINFQNLGDFYLEINTDDVKIKAPIVEGVTPSNLDQGVGHHTETPFPNRESGNVVLSGHSWLPGGDKYQSRTVFIDLDKLKIGDEVKTYYKGKEFVYKITERKIIEVESDGTQKGDTDILEKTDKPQITLYTCTPKYVDTNKRLVYIGELVN